MHPNVYKKHHKPQQFLLTLFCIMILCPPLTSQSCNFAVKKTKIYSSYSQGFLRIEGNRITTKSDGSSEQDYLFRVTIDQHYMLLYDNKTAKFICWNKHFKKLVPRRNPINLKYCKFEEQVSLAHKTAYVRYTTNNTITNKEIDIRFNSRGAFINSSTLNKKNNKKRKKLNHKKTSSDKCQCSEFLPADVLPCTSELPQFCEQMKRVKDRGHSITSEIMDLCKNGWRKN